MVGDRLAAEDVERRARDLAAVERRLEVGVDDQRAARDVEHADAVLALRERGGVEPALGRVVLGQVEREEVGPGVDVVGGVGLLDPELAVALGADERVERDHAHAEPHRALGDELADAAEAEDAERLVHELDAREARALPRPATRLACACGTLRASASSSAIVCSAAVTTFDCGALATTMPCFVAAADVDVVDADAGAADDLQAVARGR